MSTVTPDELREQAKAEHERMSVRLADELDRMIKLFFHARESLQNELFEGMGYKKVTLSDKDMKKLTGLADLAKSVVDVKIKFDKARKAMEDNLTPAEEKAAVVAYLKSCEPQDRADIIHRVKDWEAKRHGAMASLKAEVNGNPSKAG